jgi:hypothetical protein
MTLDDLRWRVDEIRSLAPDWEAAHSAEDKLYKDVLRAIAEGDYDPAFSRPDSLADTALMAEHISFPRHCA